MYRLYNKHFKVEFAATVLCFAIADAVSYVIAAQREAAEDAQMAALGIRFSEFVWSGWRIMLNFWSISAVAFILGLTVRRIFDRQ